VRQCQPKLFLVQLYLRLKQLYLSGATGNTGEATIKSLAAHTSVKVVAGVRDEKKAAEKFKDANITFVKADAEAKDSEELLVNSMKNCDAVLVIPPAHGRVEISKNIVEAARKAAVKFIALISIELVETAPNILFSQQFGKIEHAIKETKIPFCFIRCPFFMENQWGNVQSIKGQGAFYYPVSGDKKFNHVAIADIGICTAAILANFGQHKNTIYYLAGHQVSCDEMAAIYSKELQKPVKFYKADAKTAIDAMVGMGFAKWQAEGIVELWTCVEEGKTGAKNDMKTIMGRDPTTTEGYIKSIIHAFK